MRFKLRYVKENSWTILIERNPKEQFADNQYSVTTKDRKRRSSERMLFLIEMSWLRRRADRKVSDFKSSALSAIVQDYGVQYEKMETLQEYLRSGPWDADTTWSTEAALLRNIAVTKPWELLDDKGVKFIHQFFKSLRIIEKQVSKIDGKMLLLRNLENLTLSVNLLQDVPSANLPRRLKVLELCSNCLLSISSLCKNPPPLEHLGLGHNMLHSPDEYKYFTVEYWPYLLSLDLSYNNLSDLLELCDRLASLPKLRNLLLQGNPLSLVPGYRGYTVDVLRDLVILDDVHVSADEKHHFKGLARKKELMGEEAQLIVTMETLDGVPMPDELKEPPDPDSFPIVSTQYVVCYDMLADAFSRVTMEEEEERSQTRESEVSQHPASKEERRSSVMEEFETAGKEWEEQINIEHKRLHVVDDLVKFKDYLMNGMTLKILAKSTKAWPMDQTAESAVATPEQTRKKSGKRDTPTKKSKDSKTPTKPPKSGKGEKGKKKSPSAPPAEMRFDPPVLTEIGSYSFPLSFFLEGDSLVEGTYHCGGGPMMSEEEREKLLEEQRQLQQQLMEENKPDSKQSNKKGRSPSAKKKTGSAKKPGSGKKRDKKVEPEERSEAETLLPPRPITLKMRIELRKWKTALDIMQ